MSGRISRRTVLRGLGTAIALPWLEGMAPAHILTRSARAADPAKAAPLRMAFVYVPNGVHVPDWTPKDEGSAFELPYILEPLAPVKDDLVVMTGLTQDKARPNGDGAGDHARSLASFLTGCQARKTDGANIKAGVSVDQVAAQKVGHLTRFPSLELGCDPSAQAGSCDSGYSCAYSSNIAWKSETQPLPKEINPRLLFDRLFARGPKGDVDAARGRRSRYRESILDFVSEDARRLRDRLGAADGRKLDEYMTSVRELETRIGRAEQGLTDAPDDFPRPPGVPKDHAEHVRLMFDLLALAFKTDSTRIATFVLANEGSNRPYRFLGVPEGHHDLSHHAGDPKKHEKIRTINRFHVENFARFLKTLKDTPEGEGRSVLDGCMIVYGSGISDGNRHNHDNLPVLLAGGGKGTIATGRHVKYDRNTPLNNLYLDMLDRMEAPVETLGDSTGHLAGLEG